MESGKNGVNAVREKQKQKSELVKLRSKHATDVGMWVILDETLNVLLEEKPAI